LVVHDGQMTWRTGIGNVGPGVSASDQLFRSAAPERPEHTKAPTF
jgi:hypothetical protein